MRKRIKHLGGGRDAIIYEYVMIVALGNNKFRLIANE